MAQWLSWLERRPVTAEVESSSLFWVVLIGLYGVLAQLGEHLPYKQRVIGSSPIGPTSNYYNCLRILVRRRSFVSETLFLCKYLCRRGGIGRRKGLKIPRGQPRTGSSPVAGR